MKNSCCFISNYRDVDGFNDGKKHTTHHFAAEREKEKNL